MELGVEGSRWNKLSRETASGRCMSMGWQPGQICVGRSSQDTRWGLLGGCSLSCPVYFCEPDRCLCLERCEHVNMQAKQKANWGLGTQGQEH